MKIDCGFLFIVFMVLKLCNQIDWSWWWVTAPLWGFFILYFLLSLLKGMIDD